MVCTLDKPIYILWAPIGIKYRKSTDPAQTFSCYFFEKNLQGDIIAIYNESGTKIGIYTYNAWGVTTAVAQSGATSLEAKLVQLYNPFRYRGYFYDWELGYYYLQSRYYNPNWGRFLNADGYISTGTGMLGYNMFAYCNNNPVMNVDPTGKLIGKLIVLIVLASLMVMPAVIAVEPFLGDVEDLSYSDESYNSQGHKPDDVITERGFLYDAELDGNGHSGGSIEGSAGFYEVTYSWDYFELEFGCGKVNGELSLDLLKEVGAAAKAEAVYAGVYFKIPIFGHELKFGVNGNAGSIGAEAIIGAETKIGVSCGIGGGILIAWD